MNSTSNPLEIRGLRKRFDDVVAVDGIDLTLGPDELMALVGPSGCGKSTVLRSIAGLLDIDDGSIHLAGRPVDDGKVRLPPERRSVGLVFQEHALFPHLTVRDNIGFGVRGASKGEVVARVDEMLAVVSLGEQRHRYPHELSGGERQRVALARALAPRPSLMLFDEPFASLDHNLRVQLRHDIVSALRATNTPAVFVTHFQEEALALGDRIAVMREGRIVQVGSPEEVFHTPTDTFVAAFMGDASFLSISASDGVAVTALGPVELGDRAADGACAMVRPDDVRFEEAPAGECEIVAVEYHGIAWLATARLGDAEVVFATSHLRPPRVGARGRLHLNEGHRQIIVPASSS